MAINSISSSALMGLHRSMDGMQKSAAEVAAPKKAEETTDFTRSLVEMKQHALEAKTSGKVLKTADEVLGALLDVRA